MYNHYQSDYPNQVHQLLVTVSKHLFVGAKGQIRHQWKQMDVSLKTLHKSDREHLIHYFLRDHFSGAYYVEIVSSKEMIPLQDFLLRAWMEKPDLHFAGVPTALMIPKAVEDNFSKRGNVS